MISDERALEILEMARWLAMTHLKTLTDKEDGTDLDIVRIEWPLIYSLLKTSAEYSSYTPNAMKWEKMANDIKEYGCTKDREMMEEIEIDVKYDK